MRSSFTVSQCRRLLLVGIFTATLALAGRTASAQVASGGASSWEYAGPEDLVLLTQLGITESSRPQVLRIVRQRAADRTVFLLDGLPVAQQEGNILQNVTKTSRHDLGGRFFSERAGLAGPGGSVPLATTIPRGQQGPLMASASGARTMSDLGPVLYSGTEMLAGQSTLAQGGIDNSKVLLTDSKSMTLRQGNGRRS